MPTKKYAVIGHPIGHSLSPFIHKRLFELNNIDASYTLLDIADLDKSYLDVLKKLDGYNVTIPHKQDIINKLDVISEKAALCNSVNTVKNDGKSYGYSTDGYGFLECVKAKCDGVLPKDVLIFGYGGAARAIAFECIQNGCEVSFVVREKSIDKCNLLCDEIFSKLNAECKAYTADTISKDKSFSLLVNATPVGMYPHTDGCVVPDEIIKNAQAVFDCVYNPLETVLLKKAKQYNKNAIGSVDMLVYQASKAHQIWGYKKHSDADLQRICKETCEKLK